VWGNKSIFGIIIAALFHKYTCMKLFSSSHIPAIVVMCCIVLWLYSCKKAKNNSVTPATSAKSHTGKIAGNRLWKRTDHEVRYGYYDTVYHLPDTSFAITVINDSTIQFGQVVLSYKSSFSSDSMLDFNYTSAATSSFSSTIVQYYFLRDSIYCFSHSYLGGFGYGDVSYETQ
jgi:hypothetical protein